MFASLFALPLLSGLHVQVDWTDFRAVLVWLAGVGAPYVVGYIVSLLAENWPKWHELSRAVKFFAPLLLSVVLSIGATLLLQYDDLIGAISPYWTMVVGAVLFYLGSQIGYMNAKRSGYGYGPKASEEKYIAQIKELNSPK